MIITKISLNCKNKIQNIGTLNHKTCVKKHRIV